MEVQRYQSLSAIPPSSRKNTSSLLEITRSNSSIDSNENQIRRQTILWILRLRKKLTISKDAVYAAIAYLNKWMEMGNSIDEENYECLGAAMLLLSAKMNQIYPPKITSLSFRSLKGFTKEQLIAQQALIIQAFDYDVAFTETAYYFLAKILENDKAKLQQCQKLLSIIILHKESLKYGDKMLALAIVYLIKPSHIKDYSGTSLQRIKLIAGKIYNIYVSTKNTSKN